MQANLIMRVMMQQFIFILPSSYLESEGPLVGCNHFTPHRSLEVIRDFIIIHHHHCQLYHFYPQNKSAALALGYSLSAAKTKRIFFIKSVSLHCCRPFTKDFFRFLTLKGKITRTRRLYCSPGFRRNVLLPLPPMKTHNPLLMREHAK